MSIPVQKNIPLAPLTTLKVGGSAAYFVQIATEEDLVRATAFAQENNLQITVLGGGSNVLVNDEGIEGLVMHIQLMGIEARETGDTVLVTVGAGEELDAFVEHTVAQGWWGVENFSHIPGTVGATPVQNVGAYGVEAQDVIERVRVFDLETRSFTELSNQECTFAYRHSLFKTDAGKRYIIVSVTFALSRTPHPQVGYRDLAQLFTDTVPTQAQVREAVMKIRAGKFPNWKSVGTAGSFFKNPVILQSEYDALLLAHPELPAFPSGEGHVKIPLGWLLDKVLKLRGFERGNVATYKDQALVIIANEHATALEIENFANYIVQKIKNEIGIDVEWEVTKLK